MFLFPPLSPLTKFFCPPPAGSKVAPPLVEKVDGGLYLVLFLELAHLLMVEKVKAATIHRATGLFKGLTKDSMPKKLPGWHFFITWTICLKRHCVTVFPGKLGNCHWSLVTAIYCTYCIWEKPFVAFRLFAFQIDPLKASFHIPLHRYYAVFLRQAVKAQGFALRELLPDNDMLTLMMQHPLRVQVGKSNSSTKRYFIFHTIRGKNGLVGLDFQMFLHHRL